MAELTATVPYPVRLDVEYAGRQSRWKALLRLPLAVPVILFSYLLQNGVVLAIWATILVRRSIPRWLFDFQVSLNRWHVRAWAYVFLLTDAYPPFEGDFPIRYEVAYPERPSRWRLVVWKFVTSLPHLIVLVLLAATLIVVVPVAWLAILLTGRFPRGLHAYVAGIVRWGARVQAYVLSLTDEFPPFSLSPDAGPGGRRGYVMSSVIGMLAGVAVVGLFVTILVILSVGSQRIVTQVSYERLLTGVPRFGEGIAEVHSGRFRLEAAVDPADDQYAFLAVQPGRRLVELRFTLLNWRGAGEEVPIRTERFELRDTGGAAHQPLIATVNRNEIAPFDVGSGDTATLQLVFELPADARPVELEYNVLDYIEFPRFGETIIWEFR